MESREEIESMRVTDLREFLQRHGQSYANISRLDGTPGQPRKADLLSAALDLHQQLTNPKESSPIIQNRRRSLSAAMTPSKPNPFQSGIPSPSKSQPKMEENVTDKQQSPSTNQTQPNKSSRSSAVKSGRSRRSSSVWVDPALLSKMMANKSPAPAPAPAGSASKSTKVTTSKFTQTDDVPIAPVVPDSALGSASLPASSTVRARKSGRASWSTPGRNSMPKRMSGIKGEPKRNDAVVAAGAAASARFAESRKKGSTENDMEDEVQFVSQVNRRKSTSSAGVSLRKTIHDLKDEDYISDEDEDFTYDNDEDEEEFDNDEMDIEPKNGIEALEDSIQPNLPNHAKNVKKNWYKADVTEIEKVPAKSPRNRNRQQRERKGYSGYDNDVVVDSDYDRSNTSGESDSERLSQGSDAEVTDDTFYVWSKPDLKHWLQKHSVVFNPTANRVELISIARAHWMYLEAKKHDIEDIRGNNGSKRTSGASGTRRRRVISAPNGIDEDEDVAQEASNAAQRLRQKGNQSIVEATANKVAGRKRAILFMALNGLILFALIIFTGYTVWHGYFKDYCDSGDSESLKEFSLPSQNCKPCPPFGICKNGKLSCESGYQLIYGECVEDTDVFRYAGELADQTYSILCDLAGRVECGQDSSSSLNGLEISQILREREMGRNPQSTLFQRGRVYDEFKFNVAVNRALERLIEYDRYDITYTEGGEYICNQPTYTFSCAVRKAIYKNWKVISTIFGTLFLSLYLYIRRRRRIAYQEDIKSKYLSALECLRNQCDDYRRGDEDNAFVADIELRTELVGPPTSYNLKLWKEVEKQLDRDPRVVRVHKTIRGVPSYTFEWVGRRNSGSIVGSRRSSFGSRASLDSLDMRSDASEDMDGGRRNNLIQWWLARQ